MSDTTPCPHGLTRPCVRCDPWRRGDESEADLDRWQAVFDNMPAGPHRVDIGNSIKIRFERGRP